MDRNPDFPNWKHIFAMLGIYLAGSFAAAIPLGLIGAFELINGGAEIDPLNMPDTSTMINPEWISHLAPLMSALPLILCIIYGWQRLGKPKWDLGFSNVGIVPIILSIVGTLLIANGTTMVAEYLPGYESFVKAMEEMLVPGVGMAIAVVLCAPIFEEALFRGVILRGFLRKTTPFKSIVFSGLCFGALHVLPIHVFFASIVGFALGYVYYRTRSLGLVILIHLINNGVSYFLGLTDMPSSTEELVGTGMLGVLVLAAGLTTSGVGLLYLMGEKYPIVPPPAEEYQPVDDAEVAIATNPSLEN